MGRNRGLLPERVMVKGAITGIEEQMHQCVGMRLLRPSAHLDGEQAQPDERKRTKEAWQGKEEPRIERRATHYA